MSRVFHSTLFDNRNDIWCKARPTVFEHSECGFKIHSRRGCISKFVCMFFFFLCRSWDNQIPVHGVCQWPTRFIVSTVNSKLQKGGRTKMQRPDARVMQFYKASYDICLLRCECSPQHSIVTHPPTVQIRVFWDLIVACSHGRTLKVEAENSPEALYRSTRLSGATFQKPVASIFIAVRTPDPRTPILCSVYDKGPSLLYICF
jgi:hypothetical protein